METDPLIEHANPDKDWHVMELRSGRRIRRHHYVKVKRKNSLKIFFTTFHFHVHILKSNEDLDLSIFFLI